MNCLNKLEDLDQQHEVHNEQHRTKIYFIGEFIKINYFNKMGFKILLQGT